MLPVRMHAGMKLYLESYGCTLQKSESSLYVNRMLSEGDVLVGSPDEADLSIIGTCIVIRKTEDKMIRRIEELSHSSKVRVIGCLSSAGGEALSGDNVEIVDPLEFRKFYNGRLDHVKVAAPSIWEGIPINQGCTGSCNFCVSRIARGKLISRPSLKIVEQIRMQLERGIQEVKITSLDTAAYGRDINSDLPSLIRSILEIGADFMLRIGMMEPRNTDSLISELLSAMEDNRVYKFLHLPVQSGDNRVLTAMNREYTVETFTGIVQKYREKYRDGTLSTDVVVGYHCDDEDSFEQTYSLMEKTKPEIMNITRFSPRPYTRDFNSKVPPSNLIKRWSGDLSALHHRILEESLESREGLTVSAMSTETGKNGTTVMRDVNYRPIVVMEKLPIYERRNVEVTGHASTFLYGRTV